MSEFQDIYIIDLDEEKSRRNSRKENLVDFHFRLSASPPGEWTNIFMDKIIRNKTTRQALLEVRGMDKSSLKDNPEVLSLTLSIGTILGSELKWTSRERHLEKHFKILEKCVKDTNHQYSRVLRESLKQQARDRRSNSNLRDRLFGKKNC